MTLLMPFRRQPALLSCSQAEMRHTATTSFPTCESRKQQATLFVRFTNVIMQMATFLSFSPPLCVSKCR
eukprot:1436165-Karenia_brevis.AAC.1